MSLHKGLKIIIGLGAPNFKCPSGSRGSSGADARGFTKLQDDSSRARAWRLERDWLTTHISSVEATTEEAREDPDSRSATGTH